MVLTAVFLGVIPIGEVYSHGTYGILKEEARSATPGRARSRLRELLVVGQIAMALVLLVGAGLLLKSLSHMAEVNPGFDPKGVMTASAQLPDNLYSDPAKVASFYRSVHERLSALPGVSSAALAAPLPLTGYAPTSSFQIDDRPMGPGDPGPHSGLAWVTPG